MNSWIEISAEDLAANFKTLAGSAAQSAGKGTQILAVIKANAYGHGAETCAPILVRAGAAWLGVTCAEEGARVRRALTGAGLEADILVMSGSLPEDTPLILENKLTPVVWTSAQIAALPFGTRVHLEIDTAMSRQGAHPGTELTAALSAITRQKLVLDAIFTHFASSEEADSLLTRMQQQRFEQAVEQVWAAGLQPRFVHAGNSSSLDNPPQPAEWLGTLAKTVGATPMIRPGLALYGYALPLEEPWGQPPAAQVRPALRPVLTWKARLLAVRDLAVGESVGYNATFTATHPMRIATLPVGYADGLRRELSSTTSHKGGWVMIDGQRAPILGRVSMNLTVVDVTEIAAAAPGDFAIVLGPGISADDHAALASTLPYEILCAIKPCG